MTTATTAAVSFRSSGGYAKYRGYLEVSVSVKSATECVVRATQYGGMTNAYGWMLHVSSGYRKGTSGNYTAAMSSSGVIRSSPGDSWAWFAKKTWEVTVPRGDSAVTYQWYVSVSCDGDIVNGTSHVESATLQVTIPAKGYRSVYYDANGGSGAPSTQSAIIGTPITIGAAPTAPTGKTFVAWNTKKDGTGYSLAPNYSYTGSSTIALYAQWKDNTGTPTLADMKAFRADSSGTADPEETHLVVSGRIDWGSDNGSGAGAAGTVRLYIRDTDASEDTVGWSQVTCTATTVDGVTTWVDSSVNGVLDKTKNYAVIAYLVNDQSVSGSAQTNVPKVGYIIKVTPDGEVSYGVDTGWKYLYLDPNNSNNYIKYARRGQGVFVSCQVKNTNGVAALSTSGWSSDSNNPIPANLRPSEVWTGALFGQVPGYIAIGTDGICYTGCYSGSSDRAYGSLYYPLD